MTRDRITRNSRFEGTLEAHSLPVVGADRHRARASLLRLVVAAVCMFWATVLVLVVAFCG